MSNLVHSRHKGFSMIELMVVISIIGIIVAVGSVSFITAQRKSRDSSRRSDMAAVQSAMEQYFAQGSIYPTSGQCNELTSTNIYLPGGFPTDPSPTGSYTRTCVPSGATYCVCAQMETDTGNSGPACDYNNTNKTHFCVSNQQ